jgi:DNA-binding MarR family transcriptional regulator
MAVKELVRPAEAEEAHPVSAHAALESLLLSAHQAAVSLGELSAFEDNGVTVAEWAILKSIGGRRSISLKEVSATAGISRQRVRKVVSELEAKNFVIASRAQAEDRRVRLLSATEAGDAKLAAISSQVHAVFSNFAQEKHTRRLVVAASTMRRIARLVQRGGAAHDGELEHIVSDE